MDDYLKNLGITPNDPSQQQSDQSILGDADAPPTTGGSNIWDFINKPAGQPSGGTTATEPPPADSGDTGTGIHGFDINGNPLNLAGTGDMYGGDSWFSGVILNDKGQYVGEGYDTAAEAAAAKALDQRALADAEAGQGAVIGGTTQSDNITRLKNQLAGFNPGASTAATSTAATPAGYNPMNTNGMTELAGYNIPSNLSAEEQRYWHAGLADPREQQLIKAYQTNPSSLDAWQTFLATDPGVMGQEDWRSNNRASDGNSDQGAFSGNPLGFYQQYLNDINASPELQASMQKDLGASVQKAGAAAAQFNTTIQQVAASNHSDPNILGIVVAAVAAYFLGPEVLSAFEAGDAVATADAINTMATLDSTSLQMSLMAQGFTSEEAAALAAGVGGDAGAGAAAAVSAGSAGVGAGDAVSTANASLDALNGMSATQDAASLANAAGDAANLTEDQMVQQMNQQIAQDLTTQAGQQAVQGAEQVVSKAAIDAGEQQLADQFAQEAATQAFTPSTLSKVADLLGVRSVKDVLQYLGLAGSVAGVVGARNATKSGGNTGATGSAGQTVTALGTNTANTANQLLDRYNAGQLTAGDAGTVSQWQEQALAQVRQQYASMGLSNSSMEMQAEQQVRQNAGMYQSQLLQNELQSALSAAGTASSTLNGIVTANVQSNKDLTSAWTNFMNSLGKFGQTSGSPAATNDQQGAAGP
jgi:hypothetical protein